MAVPTYRFGDGYGIRKRRRLWVTTKLEPSFSERHQLIREKYVVIRISDQAEIHDAVVIRRQDRFAASAFYAYANAVLSTAEMLAEVGALSAERKEELTEIADYFTQQAYESTQGETKLPD